MILLGIVLLVVGFVVGVHVLVLVGAILALVGVCLLGFGYGGHPVGGRNHWW